MLTADFIMYDETSPKSYFAYAMPETFQNVEYVTELVSSIRKTSDGFYTGDVPLHSNVARGDVAVRDMLEQKIFRKLHFPSRWEQEGISQPHAAAKEKCLAVCKKLYEDNSLIPSAILPSKEEGIYVSYDKVTVEFDRSMKIEIYNTMEIALIVCDNAKKEIIYIEDITGLDFSRAVSIFKT